MTTKMTKTIMLLAATAAAGGGCDTFYDETITNPGTNLEQTVITFDATLPDALEDVFASCHNPLVFSPTDSSLDLGGSCTSTAALPTTESRLLWLGLNASPDVDLTDAFPPELEDQLFEVYHLVDPLAFPFQRCDLFFDLQMGVDGFELDGFDANWTTRSGAPALHADLDHTGASFASGMIDSDVDCPNPLNEPVVQGYLPNGFHELNLEGVDLDAWIKFSWSGANVTASVEVDVQISEITIDPPLSNTVVNQVGTVQQILEDNAGVDLDTIVADTEAGIRAALDPVADAAEEALEGAVPDGYVICKIEVVSGKLVMKTEEHSCINIVGPIFPPF